MHVFSYQRNCLALLLCVSLAGLWPPKLRAQSQSDPTKDYPAFHRNPQRTGWIPNETKLTPANVSGGQFGPLWNSPPFDSVTIGGQVYPPRMYASPLYIDGVTLTSGLYAGQHISMVVAATSNGYVYAVNAFARTGSVTIPAGYIFWSIKLGAPEIIHQTGDGLPVGIMGTPVIDTSTSPGRVYVAADVAADDSPVPNPIPVGWRIYAVDITSGKVLPGWPVSVNNGALAPINRNGPTTFQQSIAISQRGALNLSPDGRYLYVPFGGYLDGAAGWMVVVDTLSAKLATAFAAAPNTTDATANGGMWSSSGAAIDTNGVVYETTGNSKTADDTTPGYWAQSVLQWAPGSPLTLTGTYTPFNHCQMDKADADLAGGGPVVVPDLGSGNTSTPHLLAFGGKQGNVYLLDRDHMPGMLTHRQNCAEPDLTGSGGDGSLLPPGNQPQFRKIRAHSTSSARILKRTQMLTMRRAAPRPRILRRRMAPTICLSPDRRKRAYRPKRPSPLCGAVKDSNVRWKACLSLHRRGAKPLCYAFGGLADDHKQWVIQCDHLDSRRQCHTTGKSGHPSHPILYAFDQNLNMLWNSDQVQNGQQQLNGGGKYMTPVSARGTVFVGTDRVQAFGLTSQVVSSSEVAINSGGGVAGIFSADMDFTGGHADSVPNPIDVTGVQNPAPQAVYQTKRTGSNAVGFTYVVPQLKVGGTYNVRLHFAESAATATGGRIFNVVLNGKTVLPDFDVFAAAGAPFKAVIKEFLTTPDSSGNIVIAYNYGSVGNPLANGIEVIPIANGLRSIRAVQPLGTLWPIPILPVGTPTLSRIPWT